MWVFNVLELSWCGIVGEETDCVEAVYVRGAVWCEWRCFEAFVGICVGGIGGVVDGIWRLWNERLRYC